MASSHLRFESLKHRYLGDEYVVPLLVDENRNPFHAYTETLLRAAEIVAPNLQNGTLELTSLAQDVDKLKATAHTDTEGINGLVLEGTEGGGSVIVRPTETTVAPMSRLEAVVPTHAFFEMIHQWAHLNRQPT